MPVSENLYGEIRTFVKFTPTDVSTVVVANIVRRLAVIAELKSQPNNDDRPGKRN